MFASYFPKELINYFGKYMRKPGLSSRRPALGYRMCRRTRITMRTISSASSSGAAMGLL